MITFRFGSAKARIDEEGEIKLPKGRHRNSNWLYLLLAKRLKADRQAGKEAQELSRAGKPVYYMNTKISGNVLRRNPNGSVDEVEITMDGQVRVTKTIARTPQEKGAILGSCWSQRGR